jgi:hypothetical protein
LIEIDYVGEGSSDDVIARRIITSVNCLPGTSYRRPLSGTGKNNLDVRLPGLNQGSLYRNSVLALRDLDRDAPCAPALVSKLIPDKNPKMLLRVCVCAAESWLMADRDAYADFCGLPVADIPAELETVVDLKGLIQGFGQSGRARRLRRHLDKGGASGVPLWGMMGSWHAQFAEEHWDPIRAEKSGGAPSLNRTLHRIRQLAADLTAA